MIYFPGYIDPFKGRGFKKNYFYNFSKKNICMKKTNAIRILEQKKITYQSMEYQYDTENLTVEHIAQRNQLNPAQIYKTLVLEGDKHGIVIALIPGDKSLSLKKIASITQNKKIALLPPNDLQRLTGYIRGGCSPVGMKKNYPTFIEQSALTLPHIYFNAGTRGLFIKIAPLDLENVMEVKWEDLVS